MAHQHQVLQLLPLHCFVDGLDALFQPHRAGVAVSVRAVTGKVKGMDPVSPAPLVQSGGVLLRGSQISPDRSPTPGSLSQAVHQ